MKNFTNFIKLSSFLLVLIMLNKTVYAQQTEISEMPKVSGGTEAIMKLVKYPKEALKEGLQGRVFVKATVTKKGLIKNVELIKGNKILGKAAIEAVKKAKFIAAKNKNGNPVNAEITIPVEFKLGGKGKISEK